VKKKTRRIAMGVAMVFCGAAFIRAIVIGRVTVNMHEVYRASDPEGFWAVLGPFAVLWAAGAFQVITGWGIKGDPDRSARDDVGTKMPAPEKPE
jgi:hypothetical protein